MQPVVQFAFRGATAIVLAKEEGAKANAILGVHGRHRSAYSNSRVQPVLLAKIVVERHSFVLLMSASSVIGIPQFLANLDDTLLEVERVGVAWRGTRFEAYLRHLREASGFAYPRPFPWADEPEKQRLFFEGASQCQQLMDGCEILRSGERVVMAERLRKIVKGGQLPPLDSEEADEARNTLFELATAAALRRSRFDVDVPRHGEDLRAVHPGLLPFLVECKRPTHEGSLLKNLKKARHQLKQRRTPEKDLGLVVIGVDRLIGISGEVAVVETEAQLHTAVERTLRRQKRLVEDAQQQTSEKLFPHASIAGVLLVGAVFPADRGGIFTMSLMRLFCTGPETHKTSVRIMRALSTTMTMES